MISAALSLQDVLAGALQLSDADRATVAAEMLASLRPAGVPSEDDPAWMDEVERRAERVRRGEADSRPWEDVLAELERA